MRATVLLTTLILLSLPSEALAAQAEVKDQAATQKLADLTQKTIDQLLIERLQQLPQFIIHPRATFSEVFKHQADFAAAVIFAAGMLFIGISVAFVLRITDKIEISSPAYIYVGTIVIWVMYAIFLHVFAYILGARRGIEYTIAAYLYVISFLQPVFVLVFFALTKIFQGTADYREITAKTLGGSGLARTIVLAKGKFLGSDVAFYYRLISGILILSYFAIALSQAQRISIFAPFWLQ